MGGEREGKGDINVCSNLQISTDDLNRKCPRIFENDCICELCVRLKSDT
jgi:hypothetical protein